MVSRTAFIRTLITLLTVLLWAPVSLTATAQAAQTAPAAAAADDCRALAPGASAAAERAIAAACAQVAMRHLVHLGRRPRGSARPHVRAGGPHRPGQ